MPYYGYALLWVLPLSLVFRFVFVNALGKYPLYNARRDPSIVRGIARVHPAFGWLMLVSFVIYTHILLAFILSGVGIALEGLFGGLPSFWWAVVGALSVFAVTLKGAYRLIECIFKAVLVSMVLTFVVGIVLVGISWAELAKGFAFELPARQGLFDSGLVASSLVLATLGSMANLVLSGVPAREGLDNPRAPQGAALRPAVRHDRCAVPRSGGVRGLAAVAWSLPNAPGFVALVVVSHVLTSPFLLLIVIVLLNRGDIMAEYVNTWKENVGLGLVAVFVAVAAVQGISEAVTEIF
ncbi:MAG: divalent metal cation transporter [Pseudonocardia sp.]|nr:divalent metal cation transporter [Pseudonocardia sp.]